MPKKAARTRQKKGGGDHAAPTDLSHLTLLVFGCPGDPSKPLASENDVGTVKSALMNLGARAPVSKLDSGLKSADVVAALTEAWAADEERTFLVVWTGHGMPNTGAWQCSQGGGEVTFQDVMGAWKSSNAQGAGSKLLLLLDSCHSGAWPKMANRKNASPDDVVIQAACDVREEVPDGMLLQKWIKTVTAPEKKTSHPDAIFENMQDDGDVTPCFYAPAAEGAGKDIFDDGVLSLEGMFAALDVRLCWRCSSLVPAAGSTVALCSFVMLRPGAHTFVGVRC